MEEIKAQFETNLFGAIRDDKSDTRDVTYNEIERSGIFYGWTDKKIDLTTTIVSRFNLGLKGCFTKMLEPFTDEHSLFVAIAPTID